MHCNTLYHKLLTKFLRLSQKLTHNMEEKKIYNKNSLKYKYLFNKGEET